MGTYTSSDTTKSKDLFGRPTESTSSQTSDTHEWRLKYRCKTAAPAPSGAPASSGAPAPSAAPAPSGAPASSAAPAPMRPQASSGDVHEVVIRL